MGLDMYLGRYRKANLTKTEFSAEEYQKMRDYESGYTLFSSIPSGLEELVTEIKAYVEYYDMEKISRDFANGVDVSICMMSGDKIGFGNYKHDIRFDLTYEQIQNGYLMQKLETLYVVEGEFEVAYWRKANQIRDWFVRHLDGFDYDDNGEYYLVPKETLQELINDCKKVTNQHDLADEIMPTSNGFFFGGTEYDEWYFEALENTIDKITEVMESTDWENEVIVYTESW